MRDYVNTAKELQKMLLMLHTRSRAATTIQSTWRGWAQRRKWQPVWEAHVEQKRRLQAANVLQRVSGLGQSPGGSMHGRVASTYAHTDRLCCLEQQPVVRLS
jgi:hypothetical protein